METSKAVSKGKESIGMENQSAAASCSICGNPSDETICRPCADKIRADATAKTTGEAPAARSKPGRRRAK